MCKLYSTVHCIVYSVHTAVKYLFNLRKLESKYIPNIYIQDYSYMQQCAIGFSGVLFALKVIKCNINIISINFIPKLTV